MIPLYILGLLQRYGSQHGYQIKKTISEELSDFTQIKLPTIYYHLEKMEGEGLLSSGSAKEGSRPEKTVYSITPKGREAFLEMLRKLMVFEYRPVFPSDGVFYFSDSLETSELVLQLNAYLERLDKTLFFIQKHREETMNFIPEDTKTMASIIFSHHERHFQAELDWVRETLNKLNS